MTGIDLLAELVGPPAFFRHRLIGLTAHHPHLGAQRVDLRPQVVGPPTLRICMVLGGVLRFLGGVEVTLQVGTARLSTLRPGVRRVQLRQGPVGHSERGIGPPVRLDGSLFGLVARCSAFSTRSSTRRAGLSSWTSGGVLGAGGGVRSCRHCSPASSSSGTRTTADAPGLFGWTRLPTSPSDQHATGVGGNAQTFAKFAISQPDNPGCSWMFIPGRSRVFVLVHR